MSDEPVEPSDERNGRSGSAEPAPAEPTADAPGQWFVDAPDNQVDPRDDEAAAEFDDRDDADEFRHFAQGLSEEFVDREEFGEADQAAWDDSWEQVGEAEPPSEAAVVAVGYVDDEQYDEGDGYVEQAQHEEGDAYVEDAQYGEGDADGDADADVDDYVEEAQYAEGDADVDDYVEEAQYAEGDADVDDYVEEAQNVEVVGNGDDGTYSDVEEYDDGHYGEGGYTDGAWHAPAAVAAAEVPQAAPATPEGPPLTPLEERLGRRAAKLSYRGSRIESVYDVGGPKVRLGVLWFLLAWAGFALGPLGVGAVFVTAATVGSLQVAAHLMIEEDTNSRVTAGVITAVVGTSAIFDARVVGIVILASVVVAFVVASQTIDRSMMVQVAGLTLRASLPLGIAVAALLYLHRIDAWVFMILFGIASIYDAGNFLVGTGSRRVWVGPLAGLIGAAAIVFGAAGFEAPPLTEETTWLIGGLAALACPLGGIVGSFMLPRPDAGAPALRRLDSYLIAAPLMLALFLAIGGNRPLF